MKGNTPNIRSLRPIIKSNRPLPLSARTTVARVANEIGASKHNAPKIAVRDM